MSDAESGGSRPTKETSNEKGRLNEGHNNNRNGCRPDWSDDQYSTLKFKGKAKGLSTLGVKEKKLMD